MKQHIEKIKNIVSNMRCPLCHNKLMLQSDSLRCPGGHCYDIASKGSVNLIPNQKPTIYTRDLFKSRRAVFEAGFYKPIVNEIVQIIQSHAFHKTPITALDAGCGEGYFARSLKARLPDDTNIFALDIEKEAIRFAAGSDRSIIWMTADLANIPMQNKCVDVLLNILTPANYSEFSRVLNNDGILLKIFPGAQYLSQLRSTGQLARESSAGQQVLEHLQDSGFIVLENKNINYSLNITLEQAHLFAQMTPMLLQTDTTQLDLNGIEKITIDLNILAAKRKN